MRRALLSLVLLCGSAVAQAASVPPEVVTVFTVGRWKSGPSTGVYRIVVTQEGWEHVWSRVFVEWLADPADREDTREPIQTVELIPPVAQGSAVLEASAQPGKVGQLIITVIATSNTDVRAQRQRFLFRAAAPGVVRPVEPAGRK